MSEKRRLLPSSKPWGGPEAIACDDADPSCSYFNKWQFPWFGTVRGRLGFAWDRWLFYATGGYAYGKVQYDASLMQPLDSGPRFEAVVRDSARKSGWTAGGGVEAAITSILSVKLEYLYIDLGTRSVSAPNGFGPTQFITDTVFTSYHARDHIIRLGFNLRFGPVVGPIVARY